MYINRVFGAINEAGSNAVIAATQFLSKRIWVRTASHSEAIVGQGKWRYRVDHNWCKAVPEQIPVNNCHEMVIDLHQRLFLLTDHPQNNVIVFDTDGNVLNKWTLKSTGAHGLSIVETEQASCLWICDPYRAEVIKTTLEGQVLQKLPSPHDLGVYSTLMPYAPTQTTILPNGDVFVADGYGSQFVLRFNAEGQYLGKFGGKGNAPDQFDFAHGIAVDNRRGPGTETLLVTSRKQSCIKRFSLEGKFIGKISLPGGFPCRPVIHGENLLVSLCWSGTHLKPNSGFLVVLDENDRVLSALGGNAELGGDDGLLSLSPTYTTFTHVHDVCADSLGNLYVCQWNSGRTYPIKLTLEF